MSSADEYTADWQTALTVQAGNTDRSRQSETGLLGASDAGQCRHRAVLTVRQTPPSDAVSRGAALAGTYLHAGALAAVAELYPERIIETELVCTLPSGLQVTVHPDEIDPTEPSVTDLKFTGSLALYARQGASDAHRMQRALQYLAAHQAGLVPPEGIVRNLYADPANLDRVHIDQEPFDMAWVEAADNWYQDVAYAVRHGEDGSKDWPYHKCRSYCPFFTICQPADVEAGEITNPELREIALTAVTARNQRKEAEAVEKAAVEALKGVTGRVGGLLVKSTQINSKSGGYVKVELLESA